MSEENNQHQQRTIVTLEDIERRLIEQSFAPYFEWLKHLVTLSSLELTVLVALHSTHQDIDPHMRFALLASWICLTLAVFCGVFASRWQYKGPLVSAEGLRKLSAEYGPEAAKREARNYGIPPWSHRICAQATPVLFFVATACLCAYGIANLYSQPQLETPATSRSYP